MTVLNTAPRKVEEIPERPVDKIAPGRREAIARHHCVNRDDCCAGNGLAYSFNTQQDFKEYQISGYCQECQIRFFGF